MISMMSAAPLFRCCHHISVGGVRRKTSAPGEHSRFDPQRTWDMPTQRQCPQLEIPPLNSRKPSIIVGAAFTISRQHLM
jgi:hypothetical protein